MLLKRWYRWHENISGRERRNVSVENGGCASDWRGDSGEEIHYLHFQPGTAAYVVSNGWSWLHPYSRTGLELSVDKPLQHTYKMAYGIFKQSLAIDLDVVVMLGDTLDLFMLHLHPKQSAR